MKRLKLFILNNWSLMNLVILFGVVTWLNLQSSQLDRWI